MNNSPKTSDEWHWLKGGFLVSLLSIATYIVFEALQYKNYPFGITAGFGYLTGKFNLVFNSLSENPVLKNFNTSPAAFIEFFMLIGLVLGALTASKLSKNFNPELVPNVWKKYVHPNPIIRFIAVLIGGFLMGWGAVLASGCTSGNVLQGWAHLSPGSMVAGICFFITGIITVNILFRNMGGGV